MPNPWFPGAERMLGAAAGYTRGRTPVRSVVCHYTVGRNSTAIGLQGTYQFQVNRDGTIYQFCECDAVCWHAGSPWNALGPGIEVEYLPGYDDELWTPAAYDAAARLCQWLHDEWLVPFDFYDGPRIVAWSGFITHRSLIQTGDYHNDWWPELPRIDTPTPVPSKESTMRLFHNVDTGAWCLWDGINWTENCDEDFVNALKYAGIPFGDIHDKPLHDLHVVVGAHVEALVQRVKAD